MNFVLGIDEGPSNSEIRRARPFVYSPADNNFWYSEIFCPHDCIEIPFGVINKTLITGYELELKGTSGSVVLFIIPVELTSKQILNLYHDGKLPLDCNCNLVLPTCNTDHLTI